eukprot:gene11483-13388_t
MSGKGGMFSTLLRKSSSQTINSSSSPDSSSYMTQYGELNNECVIESEEIKTAEKNLNDVKAMLSDLVKSLKTFYDKGEGLAKNEVIWAQAFSKDHEKSVSSSSSSSAIASQYMQQLALEGGQETQLGFVKAMEQFTTSITKSSGFDNDFNASVMEGFIKPVQTLIGNIDERKVYRKKYDKALGELETLIGKVRNAQSQKKMDILKLYNYEREKTRARSNFESIKIEYTVFLSDTQNRMHTDFVDILVNHCESMSVSSGNSYTEYAGIKTYIDSLRTWCLSEQDFFQKENVERDQRRAQDLLAEVDAKFQPLIDLIVLPPFNFWYYIAEVRKNELYPLPLPPGAKETTSTPAPPTNFIPNLVRVLDARGQTSEMLVQLLRNESVSLSMGSVFNGAPIYCELIEEISNLLATPYLKYLFDASITAIICYPERHNPATASGVENLINEFNNVMHIFKDSMQYLPPPFKKASIELLNMFASKVVPGSTANLPTGCLLFGRVFAPSVARPHTHGLYNVLPSESALEALSLFSTLFANVGSNQTYLGSQTSYEVLNEAMNAWKPTIREFFASVAQSAATDTAEWESSVSITETYTVDMPVLQKFFKTHYINITALMSQNNDKELGQSFLLALGQLEADDSIVEKGHAKKSSQSNDSVPNNDDDDDDDVHLLVIPVRALFVADLDISSASENRDYCKLAGYWALQKASVYGGEKPTSLYTTGTSTIGTDSYVKDSFWKDSVSAVDVNSLVSYISKYNTQDNKSVASGRTLYSSYIETFSEDNLGDSAGSNASSKTETSGLTTSNSSSTYGSPYDIGFQANAVGVEGKKDAELQKLTLTIQDGIQSTKSTLPWNESFQELLDRPINSLEEERVRNQSITLFSQHLANTAITYVKTLVQEAHMAPEIKSIKPFEAGGFAGGEKFRIDNMFIKFALNPHQIYERNNPVSYFANKAAGHELKSINALVSCGVPNLHFPLMCLINYRGFRLIVISELPINSKTLVFGSSNAGETIYENDTVKKMMVKIGEMLNLKSHLVEESKHAFKRSGNQYNIPLAIDIEGHFGFDGRYYVVDTARLFPPETPILGITGCHLYRLFRPEFVKRYETQLCSDAFSNFNVVDQMPYNDEASKANNFLIMDYIPTFLKTLVSLDTTKMSIKETLHREGINLRYLGLILYQVSIYKLINEERRVIFQGLLTVEMLARVMRFIIFTEMRHISSPEDEPHLAIAINHLNLLFGNTQHYWSHFLTKALMAKYAYTCSTIPAVEHAVGDFIEEMQGLSKFLNAKPPEVKMEPPFTAAYYSVKQVNLRYKLLKRIIQLTGFNFDAALLRKFKSNKLDSFAVGDIKEIHCTVKHMKVSSSFKTFENFTDAEMYYLKELEFKSNKLGKDHVQVALAHIHLAELYETYSNLKSAQTHYTRAIDIYKVRFGIDDIGTANFNEKLALLHIKQKKFNESSKLLEKVLEVKTKIFKNDSIEVADTYDNLAWSLQSQGLYERSLSHYNQALRIKVSKGGSSLSVAKTLNNLGHLLLSTNDLDKSLEIFLKVQDIFVKQYGSDHSDVAVALDNIGLVYAKKKNYQMAEKYFKEAIEIRTKQFGEISRYVALTLDHLAQLYLSWGKSKYSEAAKLFQQCIDISDKFPDHYLKGFLRYNFSKLHKKKRDKQKELDCLDMALQIFEVHNITTDLSSKIRKRKEQLSKSGLKKLKEWFSAPTVPKILANDQIQISQHYGGHMEMASSNVNTRNNDIPDEWLAILNEAGISADDWNDPSYTQAIQDFILEEFSTDKKKPTTAIASIGAIPGIIEGAIKKAKPSKKAAVMTRQRSISSSSSSSSPVSPTTVSASPPSSPKVSPSMSVERKSKSSTTGVTHQFSGLLQTSNEMMNSMNSSMNKMVVNKKEKAKDQENSKSKKVSSPPQIPPLPISPSFSMFNVGAPITSTSPTGSPRGGSSSSPRSPPPLPPSSSMSSPPPGGASVAPLPPPSPMASSPITAYQPPMLQQQPQPIMMSPYPPQPQQQPNQYYGYPHMPSMAGGYAPQYTQYPAPPAPLRPTPILSDPLYPTYPAPTSAPAPIPYQEHVYAAPPPTYPLDQSYAAPPTYPANTPAQSSIKTLLHIKAQSNTQLPIKPSIHTKPQQLLLITHHTHRIPTNLYNNNTHLLIFNNNNYFNNNINNNILNILNILNHYNNITQIRNSKHTPLLNHHKSNQHLNPLLPPCHHITPHHISHKHHTKPSRDYLHESADNNDDQYDEERDTEYDSDDEDEEEEAVEEYDEEHVESGGITTNVYTKYNQVKSVVKGGGNSRTSTYSWDSDTSKNSKSIFQASLAFAIIAWIIVTLTLVLVAMSMFGILSKIPLPLGFVTKILPVAAFVCCVISMFIFVGLPSALKKDCEEANRLTCDSDDKMKKLVGSNDYSLPFIGEVKNSWGPYASWATTVVSTALTLGASIASFLCGSF